MKQRNIRRKKALRSIRHTRRLWMHLRKTNPNPRVLWAPAALRLLTKQKQSRLKSFYLKDFRDNYYTSMNRAERESNRAAKIKAYEADPGAWWLNEAKMAEWNFFYQCEHLEKKWNKPHGWWYAKRKKEAAHRRAVQEYYNSEFYRRYRAERRQNLDNIPNLYDQYSETYIRLE